MARRTASSSSTTSNASRFPAGRVALRAASSPAPASMGSSKESRPASLHVLDPHPAAHRADETKADGQAEPGAVLSLGREERLEHAVQDFGRNAGARVIDRHEHVLTARSSGDRDLARAAGALDRDRKS